MLEAINIHKSFNNGIKSIDVLKGVDIKVEKGAFVSIVGPSGAGKSTLLHILGGLDQPDEGSVLIESKEMYELGDKILARVRNSKIGFVFQFYHLLSEFTVLENVVMPSLLSLESGVRSQEYKNKAKELLNQVGLSERMSHFPNQLSGGEKQRVAIVRALMNEPGLLLCDEPTGNLDSKAGDEIISLVKSINRQKKMTVILVTHNAELAKQAETVYYLRDGLLKG